MLPSRWMFRSQQTHQGGKLCSCLRVVDRGQHFPGSKQFGPPSLCQRRLEFLQSSYSRFQSCDVGGYLGGEWGLLLLRWRGRTVRYFNLRPRRAHEEQEAKEKLIWGQVHWARYCV